MSKNVKSKISKFIMKLIPKRVDNYLRIRYSNILNKVPDEYYNDYIRYKNNAFISTKKSKENQLTIIISYYHIIEKGLSMPNIKLGFGKDVIKSLIRSLFDYCNSIDDYDLQYIEGIKVLNEYIDFHEKAGYIFENELNNSINEFKTKFNIGKSQVLRFRADNYFTYATSGFDLFSNSRHSLRNYDPIEEVSIEQINKALKLCENTPTTCNRQPIKVYVLSKKDEIQRILELQGGNRGFGHLANKVIIITASLCKYGGLTERNQAFIDGGIYLMNLLYSFHFFHIGVCTLNCCNTIATDFELRSILDVKENEVFIAMMSLGLPSNEFSVPKSLRYSYKEYTTYL